jgi:hypothetical protein
MAVHIDGIPELYWTWTASSVAFVRGIRDATKICAVGRLVFRILIRKEILRLCRRTPEV